MTTDKPASLPAKRTMPKSPGRPRKTTPAKATPAPRLTPARKAAVPKAQARTLPSGQVVVIDEAPALDPLAILEDARMWILTNVTADTGGLNCAVCLMIPPVKAPSYGERSALGRMTTAYGHTLCAVCLTWAHPDLNVAYRAAAQVRSGGAATSVGMYQRWLASRS